MTTGTGHAFTPGPTFKLDSKGRRMRGCLVCGFVGRGGGHNRGGLRPEGAPDTSTVVWRLAEAVFGGHEADWRVLVWPGIEGYYVEATVTGPGDDGERWVNFGHGDTPDDALRAVIAKYQEQPDDPR